MVRQLGETFRVFDRAPERDRVGLAPHELHELDSLGTAELVRLVLDETRCDLMRSEW